MPDEKLTRRLAAILAADVVGYSRLMGVDEAGTHARLKAIRAELVDPALAQFGGRVFKTTGDGFLAEFASAVDAVAFALAIRSALLARESRGPAGRRIELRMGVNLGDVIVEGTDMFGDGVNLAARLETFAAPCQICVSQDVQRQVRGKVEVVFEDLGEQSFKNIAEPVRVFAVRAPGEAAPARRERPRAEAAPERPSIAVMPFENMSGEAEQEFFADGITEDIITELSRFPGLFVIGRNSTFAYKGRRVKVQELGREFGVAYVVEGSVRKSGQRVRVTAQLIDATTEAHVWAERYDRELADIFDIQDEIARTVAATAQARLEATYGERVIRKPPENMAAYEYVLAAKVLHHRGTAVDNAEAQRLVEKAIEADPAFAQAYAWKCCVLGQAWQRGFGDFKTLYPIAQAAVRKAFALDPNDIEANRVLCEAYMAEHRLEDARRHHDRALALNPNDPRIVAQRGELLTWLGRAEEGLDWIRNAMRLDPYGAVTRGHLLGRVLYALGRFREAAAAYADVPEPRWSQRAELAASLAQAGEADAARAQAADVLRQNPAFSASAYAASLAFAREDDRARVREGLEKAGLPG